jgi:hypothetical protein
MTTISIQADHYRQSQKRAEFPYRVLLYSNSDSLREDPAHRKTYKKTIRSSNGPINTKRFKMDQQLKEFEACAGILEQSMWARNRGGIGLSYRPAMATQPGEIGSLESILVLLKSLKIRALKKTHVCRRNCVQLFFVH